MQEVVSKTDGVPLFVEELTRAVMESGLLREQDGHYELTSPLNALAIPSSLNDSLMARLDRLGAVKEVAQLAATLGREFSYELLQAVASLDATALQEALEKLVESEILHQRGLLPQARYIFRHALIQDAAYQSLLRSTRQQYHKHIAQTLAERFPEIKETQPELLGSSLHRGRTYRAGRPVLAAGRAAGEPPFRACGGSQSSLQRSGPAGDVAGWTGARSTGTRAAGNDGPLVARYQRLWGTGNWSGLPAGASAMSPDWGNPTAFPGTGGASLLLHVAWRITDEP